jgi:phosphatidylglycerol:prolipoprotein diacylglycerol transferase
LVGAGLILAYYYFQDRKIRKQPPQPQQVKVYPQDRIGTITTIAAISGVVGAKVFALIEDLPAFFADPVGVFFSGSGLAIYGGLIGGFVGCMIYLRRHKIDMLPTIDAVAPGLMIGYGVGRIGCQLSGDGDWGIVAAPRPEGWILPDWMWSFDYPHNVLRDGIPIEGCTDYYCNHLAELVYPSPFYETVMAFALGAVLWSLRKRLTFLPGVLFALYLVLNGIERWTIEGRNDCDRVCTRWCGHGIFLLPQGQKRPRYRGRR